MTTIVEKVARAMYERGNSLLGPSGDVPFQSARQCKLYLPWEEAARASISAVIEDMMEPSAAACEDGSRAGARPITTTQADAVFRAMLNAYARERGVEGNPSSSNG